MVSIIIIGCGICLFVFFLIAIALIALGIAVWLRGKNSKMMELRREEVIGKEPEVKQPTLEELEEEDEPEPDEL